MWNQWIYLLCCSYWVEAKIKEMFALAITFIQSKFYTSTLGLKSDHIKGNLNHLWDKNIDGVFIVTKVVAQWSGFLMLLLANTGTEAIGVHLHWEKTGRQTAIFFGANFFCTTFCENPMNMTKVKEQVPSRSATAFFVEKVTVWAHLKANWFLVEGSSHPMWTLQLCMSGLFPRPWRLIVWSAFQNVKKAILHDNGFQALEWHHDATLWRLFVYRKYVALFHQEDHLISNFYSRAKKCNVDTQCRTVAIIHWNQ